MRSCYEFCITALLDQKSRRPGGELCPTIAEIRSKLRVVCFGREPEWVAAGTGGTKSHLWEQFVCRGVQLLQQR